MGNYYSKEYKVILIEFLTKEEKFQKTLSLKSFNEKLQIKENDEEEYDFIGDPFSQYKTSFRQEVKVFQPVLTSFQISLYLSNIDELSLNDCTFKNMCHFFKRNVDKFFLLYEEKEITNMKNFEINLNKQEQIVVLEVIYSKKSLGQQILYTIEKGSKMLWRMIMGFFNLGTIWLVFTSFMNKSLVFKMALRYFFPILTLIPF